MELDSQGWVFAVAIPESENFTFPTSYQIRYNLDAYNRPAPGVEYKFEVLKEEELEITGLSPDVNYAVYVSCGSSYPGYPDLLADSLVKVMDEKTDPNEYETM